MKIGWIVENGWMIASTLGIDNPPKTSMRWLFKPMSDQETGAFVVGALDRDSEHLKVDFMNTLKETIRDIVGDRAKIAIVEGEAPDPLQAMIRSMIANYFEKQQLFSTKDEDA